MQKILLIIFLQLFIFTNHVFCQESQRQIAIGLNFPPLIGKTVSLDAEITKFRLHSFTVGVGGMYKNSLKGSLHKIGEGTYHHENSGFYGFVGVRLAPQKESRKYYLFIGGKLLGGYCYQSADYQEPFEEWFRNGAIPDEFTFKDGRVQSEGYFSAIAIEIGVCIMINQKLSSEFGIQGGHHVYTSSRQVSNISSILPGLGALNFVGILKMKYLFN